MSTDLLLIYPPVARPAEPPIGIAQIKSAFNHHNLSCSIIDANLEGLRYVIKHCPSPQSSDLQFAFRFREQHQRSIRSPHTCAVYDAYKRAVLELNRILQASGARYNASISFTDYKQLDYRPTESSHLLQAAAKARNNPFYSYFKTSLKHKIENQQPLMIGFSLIYLSQAVTTFALIGLVREWFPGVKIVLGGGLLTSWMSQPGWRNPFSGLVDECVAGCGENGLLPLFQKTRDSKIFCRPDYSDVKSAHYFSPGRILPYTTSSGCYWRRCRFCPEHVEQNRYQQKQHQQITEDFAYYHRSRIDLVHFTDNALPASMLRHLIAEPPPAPWYGYVRFIDELLDIDFCRALARSGCIMLQLGLESAAQEVLDAMCKGIQIEHVSLILKNLNDVGIFTFIYLLFGTPWEDEHRAKKTLDFVVSHSNWIQYINPAIFNLPVNSLDVQNLVTRPFYPGDLSLYHDFDHPKGWHRSRVRHFVQKEFRVHSTIKKIMAKHPPLFSSAHAPFFHPFFPADRGKL